MIFAFVLPPFLYYFLFYIKLLRTGRQSIFGTDFEFTDRFLRRNPYFQIMSNLRFFQSFQVFLSSSNLKCVNTILCLRFNLNHLTSINLIIEKINYQNKYIPTCKAVSGMIFPQQSHIVVIPTFLANNPVLILSSEGFSFFFTPNLAFTTSSEFQK